MKSSLGRVHAVHAIRACTSVAVLACFASWLGCSSSSSAGDPTTEDAGVPPLVEAGSTAIDSGASDGAGEIPDANVPDVVLTGPFYDLQYGNCPPVDTCGGDLTGVWTLTGGCVDETVFDAAKQQCPGLTSTNVKFTARGAVSADGTNIVRGTEAHFTAGLQVPEACKLQNPLAGTPGAGTCKELDAAIILGAGLKNATCLDAKDGAGGCDCAVGNDLAEYTSSKYTTAGHVLTTGARTFNYCVTTDTLSYKETTVGGDIPASFTLAPATP